MAGEATRHVQLYGAQLADPAKYRTYREHMTPILHRHGGRFTHDFTIGTVLASELAHPVDRLFLISFPDRPAAERFFADPSYLEVRRTWFEPAVTAISLIASFDQPALPSRPTS